MFKTLKNRLPRVIFGLGCWVALLVSARAQTVYVDPAGNVDNVTTFATINAAVKSFADDTIPGVNAGKPAEANIVKIRKFGPFDEAVPLLLGTNASGGGAVALTRLNADDSTLTLEGDGVKPLILGQLCYGFASLAARGQVTFVLRNLVIAPSPTTPPTRYTVTSVGSSSNVVLDNCVVTALPTGATAYTSLSDIPSGILTGTRPHDDTYIRPTTPQASYGAGIQSSGTSTVTLTNTVVTQFGNQSVIESSALVANAVDGFVVLGPGCRIANNAAGIRVRNSGSLLVRGARGNRAVIGENNYYGAGWVNLEGYARAEFSECNFIGRPQALNTAHAGPNSALYVITGTSLSLRECILGGGFAGSGGSIGINLINKPTGMVLIDNITILDHRYAFAHNTAMDYAVTNSIVAGAHSCWTDGNGTITADHCSLPTTGDSANDLIEQVCTVTQVSCTNTDPQFLSTDPADPNFAIVSNPTYVHLAQNGAVLDGGGDFSAPPSSAQRAWTLLE